MALSKEQMEQLKMLHSKINTNASSTTLEQVTPSIASSTPESSTMSQIGSGIKNFAGGLVSGFSAPGRTIQNLASSGIDKLFGTQDFGKATKEGFEKSLGVNLDSTSGKVGEFVGEAVPYVVQPGATAIKGVTGIAGRAALNTSIGTAQTGDLGQGSTIGIGGEVLSFGGKVLQQAGRGLYKLAVPLSAKESVGVQKYLADKPLMERVKGFITGNSKKPITSGETALSKGLVGTESMIGVQATRAKKEVWDGIVAPALKNSDVKINLPEFFSEIRENVIKNNPELTRQKALLNALDAVEEDYVGVDIISAEKLQKLKEGWAQFLPDKVYKGENVAGSVKEIQNEMAALARAKIYEAIDDPTVKRAYIDYGNLIALQKWGQKAMTGSKFRGGAGSFVSALKDTVVVPVSTVGGLTVYKTGEGLEFIGVAGAKTIFDIVNQPSQQDKTE